MDEARQLARFPEKLRDDLLYVIVFGPGYGESVVLRVPPDEWIVIDSLTMEPSEISPAVETLKAHNARWTGVVLTHPHADHAAGLRALLEAEGTGRIGCVAPYVAPPATWTTSDDAEVHVQSAAVEDALAAIQYQWETNATSRWELLAGDTHTFGEAKLRVLHPSKADVEAAIQSPRPDDPNALASPILVEWKGARVVLGSDLPKRGWKAIRSRSADLDLARHHAFKVSHHGSKGALHDVVLKSADRSRLWISTPFHRGHGLPSFSDGHGVDGLLKHNDELAVTSLRDVESKSTMPRRATRQDVRDLRAASAGKSALAKGVRAIPRPGMDPGGWIAAGFSEDGLIADRQYGEGASIVVDAPTTEQKRTTRGKTKK